MKRRASAGLALLAMACSVDPVPERAGTEAMGIAIDSVRFLPIGSRYVLRDSAVPIAFLGYHAGYLCSRFLDLGLAKVPAGSPPAYRPATRVLLPGWDECAVDSGGRDTTSRHVFAAGSVVRLADPAGRLTDTATLVGGRLDTGSIRGVPGADRAFASGKLTYRDSSSLGYRVLEATSLPACLYLNSADWEKGTRDTLVIRYTLVTLDPGSSADSCNSGPHADARQVYPRKYLRPGNRAAFP